MIVLENKFLMVELFDTENVDDKHFSSRFNHLGYIRQITDKEKNKQLLTMPFNAFEPFHGEGFPDEFEMPLGYDEAKVGEGFVKIGVGVEKKTENKPYTNWDKHEIIKRAENEVKSFGSEIIYTQNLEFGSFSYQYEKIVKLIGSSLKISHRLKNKSEKNIKTLWYSHPFFDINLFEEKIILDIPEEYKLINGNIKTKNIIPIDADSKKGICFNWNVSENGENKQILLNKETTIYSAKGDFDFPELQIYVNEKVVSVEPKKIIELNPGEEFSWATEYRFK